jgi:hypothetical protein
VQDEVARGGFARVVGDGAPDDDAVGNRDVLVLDRPDARGQERRLDDVAEGVAQLDAVADAKAPV